MNISSLQLLLTNKESGDYGDSLFKPLEDKKEMDFDVALWLMRESRKNGAVSIYLTGGEAFLYSKIKELLKEANDLGYNIEIETNGRLFLKNIDWLKNVGVMNINIPFLGITAKTHDSIRGKYSFWENLAATEAVKNFGYKLGIRYIFGRHNILEGTNAISFINSLNPDYSLMREILPFGRSLDNNLCLDAKEAKNYYNQIKDELKKTRIQFSFNNGGPPYEGNWSCKSLQGKVIACDWNMEASYCRVYIHGCQTYIIDKNNLNKHQFETMYNILANKINQFWNDNPNWQDGCERCLAFNADKIMNLDKSQ